MSGDGATFDLTTVAGAGYQMAVIKEGSAFYTLAARVRGGFDPIPAAWQGFQLIYRWGESRYHVRVSRTAGPPETFEIHLDGQRLAGDAISLVDDGQEHEVLVCLKDGAAPQGVGEMGEMTEGGKT